MKLERENPAACPGRAPAKFERIDDVLPRVFTDQARGPTEAELIALDAIEEIARSMIDSAISLHADACAADIICVDVDLSQLRLEIIAAITTLREVRPRPAGGER